MRALSIVLALSTTLAFAQLGAPSQPAQGYQRTWTIGAQTYSPTLKGHANGIQDGQPLSIDLDSDLGLNKDKAIPGFFFDYQGPRFAFQVSSGKAEYIGDRVLNRDVTINGVTYTVGTRVQSQVKLGTVDAMWTTKFVREPDAWLGLDLGVQAMTLDMNATGTVGSVITGASTSLKQPIPQIGLSGGSTGFNRAVESKLYIHYLAYKRAKSTVYGLDLRIFPVSWFGLRGFYEASNFDVPKGSIKDDLEVKLERKGYGFGAVVRF